MNRLARILPVTAGLLGAIFLFACSGDVIGPPDPGPAEVAFDQDHKGSKGPVSEFTHCRPLPAATASAWIGARGGTLRAGKHAFVVPAGALKTRTLITMVSHSESINRVSLGPEGLTFDPRYAPHLVMSYKNCAVPPGAKQEIVHVDHSLQILETTPSASNSLDQIVDGVLSHFSDYVILSTYAVVY